MGTDFPIETPANDNPFAPGRSMSTVQATQPFGMLSPNSGGLSAQPGNDGARYYTIQRVNGNGANGKGDGTAGAHKHSIEDSDRVKKSSIHRYFLKEEKEKRKSLVRHSLLRVKSSWSVLQIQRISNSKGLCPLHAPICPGVGHHRHCTLHSSPSAVMVLQTIPHSRDATVETLPLASHDPYQRLASCQTILIPSNRRPTTRKLQELL